MKRRGLLLPTVVALVAAAALVGVAPAARPADGCPAVDATGTVPATTLESPVSTRACALAGKVVGAGPVAVRVPLHEGEAVTAAGSARTGHPTTLTVERRNGRV